MTLPTDARLIHLNELKLRLQELGLEALDEEEEKWAQARFHEDDISVDQVINDLMASRNIDPQIENAPDRFSNQNIPK